MNIVDIKYNEAVKRPLELIVIGASWGGMEAVTSILSPLPKDFPLPILIVQHRQRRQLGAENLLEILNHRCQLNVLEPDDKDRIEAGNIYLSPSGYHMFLENKEELAISDDEPLHYSRPAIDLLFESAARCYGNRVIGIILTGANQDGAKGLHAIKSLGGFTLVQDPETAEVDTMPLAAVAATKVDAILPLSDIASFLMKINQIKRNG